MPVRNEADPEWDHHKAKIEYLYVEGNLKLEGPGELMETMAKDYGFTRKKSQYETHFKTWGTRKYRRKDEWKRIGRNIAERKRVGKASDVLFNGDIISRSKVQKETRRHGFVTALEQSRPAPIPPIPDGFEIRTPPSEGNVPLPALPGDTPSLPNGTDTRGCPSSQLQIVSSTLTSQTMTRDASLSVLQNIMSPSAPITDFPPTQSQNTVLYTSHAPETCASPVNLEDQKNYFRRLSYASHLPFFKFEDALHAQLQPSLMSKIAQISGSELTLKMSLLAEHHHDVSHRDDDVLHMMLKDPVTLTAVLKALLPSEDDQMILRSNYPHSDSTSWKIFSLLIFAMANNFAGLYTFPIEEIMGFLNRHASSRLLQHIFSTSGPESEAFAEKLFRAAILMEDANIAKALLQKGFVPHDLVCVHLGTKLTPLEYSSMVWNIEITRLLLNAKFDVNKSFEGEGGPHSFGGAIGRAFIGPWWDNERSRGLIPFELVQMLLEAGSKFSWLQLKHRNMQGNQEVLDLLVDNAFNTKTYDEAWYQFFVHVTTECDNATATRIVTRFLEVGVASTLNSAAQRGNLELVQILLRSHVPLDRDTLTCALKSRNKELIRFLLDNGAVAGASDGNGDWPWSLHCEMSPTPSPLSEAIRWGDAEILKLLEQRGAWSPIVNKTTSLGKFKDVLIAATVQRQLAVVHELLNFRPTSFHGEDLGDALLTAIYAKEETIVLALLEAGADVNAVADSNDRMYHDLSSDTAAIGSVDSSSDIDVMINVPFGERPPKGPALVEALLHKNEQLVRLILDADVNFAKGDALRAAIQWGNLSLIKELIWMGIDVGEAALEVSVEKKDMKCTQLLLDAGANVNCKCTGSSALRAAVSNNDIGMVDYLLSVGANPADSEALFQALSQGLPMVERLLTAFSRSYPRGKPGYGLTTLCLAIQEGNSALIELLLNAKIHIKIMCQRTHFSDHNYDDRPMTPLGAAIVQQHDTSLAILQILLDEIGDPNILARIAIHYNRETALLVAIDTKDIRKVQLLVDARANVNWPATKGVKRTPLQKAAEVGSFEITQLLIKHGGLVNNEPAVRGGATALQLAAIGGYIGIALLLLEKGANVNAPAAKIDGRTALEGAAEHGRIDMLKLLWNANAKFHGDEYEKARELAKGNGHMATWRYLESLYGTPEGISMDT